MFFDPAHFPFTALFEANWLIIRQELEQLQSAQFMPWAERFLYQGAWEVFGFYAFGRRLDENCQRCPQTTAILEQVPNLTTAGFSCLQPGTHILPHTGYTSAVLRCHLGLVVPEGCSMRVGTETRQWQEGKCLVFNDTIEHEVWHRGNTNRIVLLLDFKKPEIVQPIDLTVPNSVAQMISSL
ncbi:aspartyl/asparaginyl beta-hydroxylase domain-containing protein [Leptolyngbya sp. FACHB-17]|uniref:aspartyl/asparaginyl beta-hydroxylase domain-containing protein n=1 Tax=unclassified Leptolyngbya TaxID=2650499 RepID=UPI001681ADE3|nr:aspartyl/asparaginyl beta-hydroxylase domain-containing protein [Leptolyngbya sp. FACHB-17]MBD2078602.1 aspartyl/asparaginyl beta-hydroxylase domain-containing protein [Leptolyngbya sp. FACHB-17]